MAWIRHSLLVGYVAANARYGRQHDKETQVYGPNFWYAFDQPSYMSGLICMLVYNRTRQRFEKIHDLRERIWVGWNEKQPVNEFLSDARDISRNYGLEVGVMYTLENILEGTRNKLENCFLDVAEFIYYKVPFGYYVPGIENLV